MSETCEAQEYKKGWGLKAITSAILSVELHFPLASRGFLSIFDQAIFSGTSFLTAVLIGRTTSPDQLGVYYLLISIIVVVSGMQEQIVAAPYIVYSKRRHGREFAEYAGSVWAHHFSATVLAMIGLLAAIIVLSIMGRHDVALGLGVLLAATPMLLIRLGIRRFTFANLELKSAVALDVSVALLQLGGLLLLRYFGWLSLPSIFAVMGSSCGLACLGWYFVSRPRIRFVHARFLQDWRHNWGFGKWALRTYLLGSTTGQFMPWLVSAAVGPAATGIFGACGTLIGIPNAILCAVENVLAPQAAHAFATGGVKDLRRILVFAGAFMGLAIGGFCLFVFVTGDWLVVFAFGEHYQGTGGILMLLAASMAMSALSALMGNGLWAIDQPRANFVADVCCMTVTLGAAALLIYPFGAWGAALSTLAGSTAAAVVRSYTLIRCLEGHALESGAVISAPLMSEDFVTVS